ncbi:aminoalcoholphosphotransferase [Aspergillus clavatus NRRL 1]|uniref:diacylglycerol cholinephosphotransferase n=1 Tax=Aspergillus clavatus (strain ATCC 1007 / CBS 513.65 / DSM 816 / NCTC 3887 / NRRL 1 / QM 1276 / 107) TaxID=344612 RepID=A1CJD4_ASPCL|nr:aminoalcoholphosphotransferase [Aspergillus clavatus NRRL 1]EAW09258.1 aminoalcoholphosphotransferase [Aspergillus clavatus NRRL 1]
MVYIRQQQLPNLKTYRYAGVDHSLISRYVLKPFYSNCVIDCFPMSMAFPLPPLLRPNAITLTGFMFVVINFITVLWYNPTLDHDCPPWVYASCAIGLFLYQTFDAVDGMQARRTRQSGPLGELFDHSVDACNTALGVVIFAGVTNMGQTWATILSLFGATMAFYVQTWDEYYTQVLTLGIISGPVEGILTLCTVFAFTAYQGGGSFWHRPMLETLGVPRLDSVPEKLYEMPFTQWYLIYGAIILFFATGSSIVHVMKVRSERGLDPIKPLYGLIPLVTLWALVPAYLYLQPVILEVYTVPFMLFVGLINAYAVGNMIVAHLIKADFPFRNIFIGIAPLAFGVLDSAGPFFGLWPSAFGDGSGHVSYVFACLGLLIGVYGSFVHDVITTICDYIDIWCLIIKHPHVEERPAVNGQTKKIN